MFRGMFFFTSAEERPEILDRLQMAADVFRIGQHFRLCIRGSDKTKHCATFPIQRDGRRLFRFLLFQCSAEIKIPRRIQSFSFALNSPGHIVLQVFLPCGDLFGRGRDVALRGIFQHA